MSASRMAVIGRQKFQRYFSFHSTTRTRTRPTRRSGGRSTRFRCTTASFARSRPTATCRSPTAPGCRDDQPGRCRRGDRLLEREVPLELLAPDHRHARGGHRRQPRHHSDPAWLPLFDPATPVAPGRPRWSPRRSPTTRPATTAPPARSCAPAVLLRHRPGRVQARSNKSGTTRSSPGCPTRSARTSTPASGRDPLPTADIQGANLGQKVARYQRRHYFQPTRLPLRHHRSHPHGPAPKPSHARIPAPEPARRRARTSRPSAATLFWPRAPRRCPGPRGRRRRQRSPLGSRCPWSDNRAHVPQQAPRRHPRDPR